LIIVDDCQANPPTLFPTGTPVPPPLLENIKPGDVLADVQAAAIPVETFDGLQTALSAAGSTTAIPTDGMMIGFVWDKDHKGIEGATLTGGSTVYYGDTDAADGLFTTGGSPNTKTSSTGLWVIPGAPIGTYGAQAAGRTFPNWTAGAIPRGAMVLIFEAQ
ncbi:MAG TPA: hypothetical protein PKW90_04860, partial [Myxococcota bacterium]|nr:hypothetical protein [Myxococcota bacterium]